MLEFLLTVDTSEVGDKKKCEQEKRISLQPNLQVCGDKNRIKTNFSSLQGSFLKHHSHTVLKTVLRELTQICKKEVKILIITCPEI